MKEVKTKAKANIESMKSNVKLAVEKGDQRLERSRHMSNNLLTKLKVRYWHIWNNLLIVPMFTSNIVVSYFCQSDLEKENRVLHKDFKNKELVIRKEKSVLVREKRGMDKHSVGLHLRLDSISISLDLLRSEQSYNISSAVIDTKQEERSRYAEVLQTQKEECCKLLSTSMVCLLLCRHNT